MGIQQAKGKEESLSATVHETAFFGHSLDAFYHDDSLQLSVDARNDSVATPIRREEAYPREQVQDAAGNVESPGSLAHQLNHMLEARIVPGRESRPCDQHPEDV